MPKVFFVRRQLTFRVEQCGQESNEEQGSVRSKITTLKSHDAAPGSLLQDQRSIEMVFPADN